MVSAARLGVLLLAFAGASAAAGETGLRAFAGPAYTGPVEYRIVQPGAAPVVRQARGIARITPGVGRAVTLELTSEVPGENTRSKLTADGEQGPGGWRSASGGMALTIRPDGRIEGGGATGGVNVRMHGQLDATRLRLTRETDVTGDGVGVPPGTRITETYDLRRAAAPAQAGPTPGPAAPGDGGCRMEMRPIGTSTGVVMAQVPVCE